MTGPYGRTLRAVAPEPIETVDLFAAYYAPHECRHG